MMATAGGREEATVKAWRFSAEAKVVVVVCYSVAALLIDNMISLLVLFMPSFALMLLSRPGRRRLLYYALFSLAAVWGFLLTQSIFYAQHPRTVLMELVAPGVPLIGPLTGGISIYLEGAVYGALQSLRFMAMMTAGLTLVWTTTSQELLKGLRRLRLPYKAAFMTAAALRFIPSIAAEARETMGAMRSRGYPLRPSRPWRYLTAATAALGPILFRNMRRATMLADAVESRGFTMLREDRMLEAVQRRALEKVAIWMTPVVLLLLVAAKLFTSAALYGVYYNEGIGWIYGLVETFL
jgi:energy-coupling factor transport system permease protein